MTSSTVRAEEASCQAVSPDGPVFVTDTCVDPVLREPYVDADRPGTTTDPATGVAVHYRYIHGGFTGTEARFAFYFPAPEEYRGRFFQSTYPTLTDEEATPDTIAFAISHGAYVVSTNNAGGVMAGGALAGYRANAAAAKYSRVVAAEVYGTTDRPRGYLYGGSGGAYQTLGALENTSGVWDGGVPFVPGIPDAAPNFGTVQVLALRRLRDKLPQIADAVEPGGSGDPFAGLNPDEHAALLEVTRLGMPLGGWWEHPTLDGGALPAVHPGVRMADPDYVTDFWTLPEYEGSDAALQAERVQHDTTVERVDRDTTTTVTLASAPAGDLRWTDLVITSGPGAGQTLPIKDVVGNTVTIGMYASPDLVTLLDPGISVRIDNSWPIALTYYHRHQPAPLDAYGWDQYRDEDGNSLHPQRAVRLGASMAAGAGGAAPTGRFHGKMIMVACTLDIHAYPWAADWYRRQAEASLGDLADRYRLWYVDKANHGPLGPLHYADAARADHLVGGLQWVAAKSANYIVPYLGVLQQALLDLDAWVADATPAPATTGYVIDANTQVQLANTAEERHSVQPVVSLAAMVDADTPAAQRVDVPVGARVTLVATAQVPPGTGEVVRVEWDLEGSGSFAADSQPAEAGPVVTARETHVFTSPGTYFPTVRVTAHRGGVTSPAYALIDNIARVRVVVHSDTT